MLCLSKTCQNAACRGLYDPVISKEAETPNAEGNLPFFATVSLIETSTDEQIRIEFLSIRHNRSQPLPRQAG